MESMLEEDWSKWEKTVSEAFKGGAVASASTVFVASGGSSAGIVCLWAGDVLAVLSEPKARAMLAQKIEEAMPGWLWSARGAPGPWNPEGWSEADYHLKPLGDQSRSSLVRQALQKEGAMAQALDLLDQFAGAPSWRLRVDGLWSPGDIGKGRRPTEQALAVPASVEGKCGPNDFALAMSAQSCKIHLGAISAQAPDGKGQRQRM